MKLINTAIITIALLMTGCASVDNTEQDIANLSQKVDELSNEITKLKSQQQENSDVIGKIKTTTEQLATDSQKTNERIDNIVASYKK
ncbi:Lpp/OprI family alanine-zipper lipoprotein [Colwelliaceae bacterium 6471]